MLEVELRLLGTHVLGFRLGRVSGEGNDEWWRGYRDGRWDRDNAEDDDEDDDGQEVDPSDYIWLGGQPISLNHAKFAAVGENESELDWDELQEEWADLDDDDS